MAMAHIIAARSTCERLRVGSIIVSSDYQRLMAVGYNGSYAGGPNGCETREPGLCGCVHAEANCCIKLDYHDPAVKYMYVTNMPCPACAKMIVNARVSRVRYTFPYRDDTGVRILRSSGVDVEEFPLTDLAKLPQVGSYIPGAP